MLFFVTLFAEVIANDKPLLVSYKGELLSPVLVDYPEEKFGGFLAITNYRDPFVQDEISLMEGRLRFTLGSKFEHNDYTGFEYQPSDRLLFKAHEDHTLWSSVSSKICTS